MKWTNPQAGNWCASASRKPDIGRRRFGSERLHTYWRGRGVGPVWLFKDTPVVSLMPSGSSTWTPSTNNAVEGPRRKLATRVATTRAMTPGRHAAQCLIGDSQPSLPGCKTCSPHAKVQSRPAVVRQLPCVGRFKPTLKNRKSALKASPWGLILTKLGAADTL